MSSGTFPNDALDLPLEESRQISHTKSMQRYLLTFILYLNLLLVIQDKRCAVYKKILNTSYVLYFGGVLLKEKY